MADLRSKFLEDYAGGFLNVSRQELSTSGEVLSQDGFVSEGTLYVEDGSGVKSGLLLGVGLVESVDPTTEQGLVNVRYADRTYASIRDLKIFTTAIASAQYSLADAAGKSITNLEQALQLIEDGVSALDDNVREALTLTQTNVDGILTEQARVKVVLVETDNTLTNVDSRLKIIEGNRATATPVALLDTSTNSGYYNGTIGISAGVVTGVDTNFSADFDIGDTFAAVTTAGIRVEFTVRSFDTAIPGTRMTVTPSNQSVTNGSRYEKNQTLETRVKLNEIITVLKKARILG